METTEMNFCHGLKTRDVYDPDKISKDEDLIRRYYLRTGTPISGSSVPT